MTYTTEWPQYPGVPFTRTEYTGPDVTTLQTHHVRACVKNDDLKEITRVAKNKEVSRSVDWEGVLSFALWCRKSAAISIILRFVSPCQPEDFMSSIEEESLEGGY